MNVSVAPSSIALSQARPITVAVLAMGGQGGGVLVDWIVALAERRGWFAQSTSVPGVAQRTGATIYYIEMIAPDAGKPERHPVLSLMPAPGKVDIVIGAELMEAGRAILRGLVSPDRTLLIGSSHRSLAVSREDRARRRHRRRVAGLRGGECRRQPLHRVRHGRDRGCHRQRGLLGAVRRARGLRRPALHDRGF